MKQLLLIFVIIASCGQLIRADVSHLVHGSTPKPAPANPYIFSYQAGRMHGQVDRQHTEVSDGSGVIRGAFSYIDPKNELRTVQYVADKHGFHPQLSHENEDSEAVKRAKQKHFQLYNQIAHEHANQLPHQTSASVGPQESEAVVRATNKHLNLYDRIAAEHAAIGAQQEAQRKALEAAGALHGDADGDDGQYRP